MITLVKFESLVKRVVQCLLREFVIIFTFTFTQFAIVFACTFTQFAVLLASTLTQFVIIFTVTFTRFAIVFTFAFTQFAIIFTFTCTRIVAIKHSTFSFRRRIHKRILEIHNRVPVWCLSTFIKLFNYIYAKHITNINAKRNERY